MAVPTFLAGVLNTDFNYLSRAGVADTITVLNDLNTQLTALGWTCSVTGASPNAVGTYQSLTRSDGAFIKIVATQPAAATTLSYVVTDSAGLTMVGAGIRQYIDAGGTEVRIYGKQVRRLGRFHARDSGNLGRWDHRSDSGGARCSQADILEHGRASEQRRNRRKEAGIISTTSIPPAITMQRPISPLHCNMPSNGTRLTQSGSLLFMPVEVDRRGRSHSIGPRIPYALD